MQRPGGVKPPAKAAPKTKKLGEVDTSDLRVVSQALIPAALKVKVTSIQTDETAKLQGRDLRAIEKQIKERFRIPKQALDTAKRSILSLERDLLSPIARAINHIGGECITYKRKMDREAELERIKQATILADKAKAAAEADAKAAEIAGEKELAQEIREEPVHVPLPAIKTEVAKVAGASMATTWQAEVIGFPDSTTKFLELVTFVATNPQHINLLNPNMVALNAMARAQKQGFSIPGVRAVSKQSMRL